MRAIPDSLFWRTVPLTLAHRKATLVCSLRGGALHQKIITANLMVGREASTLLSLFNGPQLFSVNQCGMHGYQRDYQGTTFPEMINFIHN